MSFRTIFFIGIALLNCSLTFINTPKIYNTYQTNLDKIYKLESYIEKSKIDNSKLQNINFDCAILIYPTDRQISEMKKEQGEESFYTVADDNMYYQGTAIGLLDSLKIKTITAEKTYLKLTGEKNSWTLNLRKKGLPAWNLILFKKDKEPQVISTVGINENQICEYFNCKKTKLTH